MNTTRTAEIVQDIYGGMLDDSLETIGRALQSRRRMLQERQANENQMVMTPGTRVRTSGNLSPKYLLGIPGTVVYDSNNNGRSIKVELDYLPPRARRYRKILSIPANCLELASSEESALSRLAGISE